MCDCSVFGVLCNSDDWLSGCDDVWAGGCSCHEGTLVSLFITCWRSFFFFLPCVLSVEQELIGDATIQNTVTTPKSVQHLNITFCYVRFVGYELSYIVLF
jgi:hypothetical protein